MEGVDKEKILKEVGRVCVSCGNDITKENINLYRRGSNDIDEAWDDIDPMCNDCFEELDTGKSERKNRAEIQRIISMIEEGDREIDNDKFSIELIRIMAED